MIAGSKYRGDLGAPGRIPICECLKQGNVILFIDDSIPSSGAGKAEGMDAANISKSALARGELQCIGATTIDEHRKNIEKKDAALERLFQPVMVGEPTAEERRWLFLKGFGIAEAHHKVHRRSAGSWPSIRPTDILPTVFAG